MFARFCFLVMCVSLIHCLIGCNGPDPFNRMEDKWSYIEQIPSDQDLINSPNGWEHFSYDTETGNISWLFSNDVMIIKEDNTFTETQINTIKNLINGEIITAISPEEILSYGEITYDDKIITINSHFPGKNFTTKYNFLYYVSVNQLILTPTESNILGNRFFTR